jgi:hypothetical protein
MGERRLMLERKHIAAIKAAQKDAGLDDQAYRDLLQKEAGVSSCKDLRPEDVSHILKAIRNQAPNEKGWKPRQIRKYQQYCKFAGMTNKEGRTFLCETTGIFHEGSPHLNQGHFDKAMAEI